MSDQQLTPAEAKEIELAVNRENPFIACYLAGRAAGDAAGYARGVEAALETTLNSSCACCKRIRALLKP